MKSRFSVPVVVAALVCLAVAPVAVAGSGVGLATLADDGHDEPEGPPTNVSASPGERLSAAVGVHEAEIEGEIEERTFAVQVARAGNDERRAAVVADRLNVTRERLTRLQHRRAELRDALANGNVTEGQFAARMARINAEAANVDRLANASDHEAASLPAGLLERKGVDADAIRTLRENASELTGGEVSEIARSIAGEKVGHALGPDRGQGPPNGTPGEGPPNGTPGEGPPNGTPGQGPPVDRGSDAPDNESDSGQENSGNGNADAPGNGGDAPGNGNDGAGNGTAGPPDDRGPDAPGNGSDGGQAGNGNDRAGDGDDSGNGAPGQGPGDRGSDNAEDGDGAGDSPDGDSDGDDDTDEGSDGDGTDGDGTDGDGTSDRGNGGSQGDDDPGERNGNGGGNDR